MAFRKLSYKTMQVDTTTIHPQDTLPQIIADTSFQIEEQQNLPSTDSINTVVEQLKVPESTIKINRTEIKQKQISDTTTEQKDSFSKKSVPEEEFVPYTLFPNITSTDSSIYKAHSPSYTNIFTNRASKEVLPDLRNISPTVEKGWVFGIAVFSTLILLVIRLYFQKQLSTIITSSVNFQMADKLMREKNAMVRRVYFLLNINFIISLSLYMLIVIQRASNILPSINEFRLFLLLAVLFIAILSVRLILINFIGRVFNAMPVFREYIHTNFLLNKNLGLYLLPIVLSIFYLPNPLSDIGFYTATILVIISLVYRYLRSIQIILRHKVLYFYTILYLCTLEILPALVGFKFVLSLR